MNPIVSVVMPMRNAAPYVGAAIRSVLSDSSVPLELVVVDDQSTDDSISVVKSISDNRIVVIEGPGRGIAACLNAGFSKARGEILMRCDADDEYTSGRVQAQFDWLLAHPEAGAVCGAFCSIDEKGNFVSDLVAAYGVEESSIEHELQRGITRTSLCTFALRSTVMRRTGPFNELFITAEDIDFMLRLGDQCQVGYLPTNLYRYRIHQRSITHTQATKRREYFDALARELHKNRHTQRVSQDEISQRISKEFLALSDSPASAKEQIQNMHVGQCWRAFSSGDFRAAFRHAWSATVQQPLAVNSWINLVKVSIRITVAVVRHRQDD